MKKYLNNLLGLLILWLLPLISYAAPLQSYETGEKQSAVNTIWVVGNTEILAAAFQATAMIFSASTFNSAVLFACLLAIGGMTISLVTQRNMRVANYLIFMVLSLCLFLPKTTVHIASYYGQDATGSTSGGTIGAVKSIDVSGVPIGVAWPLGISSNVAKKFTELFETAMQPVSAKSSYLIQGAEGYFSPIKTTLRMREAWNVPSIMKNLTALHQYCLKADSDVKTHMENDGGIKGALMISRDISGGKMIPYTTGFSAGDPSKNPLNIPEKVQVTCSTAGALLYYQMLSQVYAPKGGYSPVAERLAKSRSLNNIILGVSGGSKDRYDAMAKEAQDDINSLAKKIVSKTGAHDTMDDPNVTYQKMLDQIVLKYGADGDKEPPQDMYHDIQGAVQGLSSCTVKPCPLGQGYKVRTA